VDGGQHIEAKGWWADMKRQNAAWVEGERILRFPSWVIRDHPDEAFAQVRAALMAAGWRDLGAKSVSRQRNRTKIAK
jgi:very-short-patch-repair endonuclease